MNRFLIDGFDFGLDLVRNHVKSSPTGVDVVMVGDDSVIQTLIDTDDWPWSWLFSAPMLYLRDFAFSPSAELNFSRDLTDNDLNDYDISHYVMEHCDIVPCHIALDARVFTAVGNVHNIQESPVAFDVCFKLSSAS